MWRSSFAALLLSVLLLLWCNSGDARPLFGLLSLILNRDGSETGISANGTATASGSGTGLSLLESLASAHAQHNLAKLQLLADLLGIGSGTGTGSASGSGTGTGTG
ncbi:unnamed protein product [Chrysodeixis includens]|uniref:Uncharacterized protein n=1 Tax=Chrysodeixis includens TaxID=689277 RepID=A0A9P0FY52_CHRIL|nr:unnamed protein product [Chrysodeixis includens]